MEVPRHTEIKEHGPRRSVPPGRLEETGEQEELQRLLREANRLIEEGDLPGASAVIGRICELDSLR